MLVLEVLHDREQSAGGLGGLGWTSAEVEEGIAALERHLTEPQSLEEQLVHDANYWEAMGPFGIAKAFTTGGARGQRVEETLRIARAFVDRPEFRTPTARRLAPARRAYAHTFLDELERELATLTMTSCSLAASPPEHCNRGTPTVTPRSGPASASPAGAPPASAPVIPLVKRPDERVLTMQAFDHPVFVEDMARHVSLACRSRSLPHQVRIKNLESIHSHDAIAEINFLGAAER